MTVPDFSDAPCVYADPQLFDQPDGHCSRVPLSARIAASYCADCPKAAVAECAAGAVTDRVRGVRAGRWWFIDKDGHHRSTDITPLRSKPIPVIHHNTQVLGHERKAS